MKLFWVSILLIGAVLSLPSSPRLKQQQNVLENIDLFQQVSDSASIEEAKTKLNQLKLLLIDQRDMNDRNSDILLQKEVKQAQSLDNDINKLKKEESNAVEEKSVIDSKINSINLQLYGKDVEMDSHENEQQNELFLNLESPQFTFQSTTPPNFPLANTGSILYILKMVFEQMMKVDEACAIDSSQHSIRGGIRIDVEAVNMILENVLQSPNLSGMSNGVCGFCNYTMCRKIANECFLELPKQNLPIQVKSDISKCWKIIDNYCNQLPGSRDPGCSCTSAQRCWSEPQSVGRCPYQQFEGPWSCKNVPPLDCSEYYFSDISELYESPFHSSDDENLISELRDFRKRILSSIDEKKKAKDIPQFCVSDIEKLTQHFKKTEVVASMLFQKRSEALKEKQTYEAILLAKRTAINSASETKQQILNRISHETQSKLQRRTTVQKEIDAINTIIQKISVLPQKVDQEISPNEMVSSCQELKRLHRNSTNGIYWISLEDSNGEKKAVQVYCDMKTDGGGWTLIWKNVGGAINQKAKLLFENNFDLINSKQKSDLVTPLHSIDNLNSFENDRHSQFNSLAYQYFSTRRHQEWRKSMGLFRGSNLFSFQNIRLEFGNATFSSIFESQNGCSDFNSKPIKVYSSFTDSEETSYFMGETKTMINREGVSYGLATSSSYSKICGKESNLNECTSFGGIRNESSLSQNPLVCDFSLLRTLGDNGELSEEKTFQLIENIFSHIHTTVTPREANQCMYRCWESNDDNLYNDAFVWAVRGKCPEINGKPCGGQGDCHDGYCYCNEGFYGDDCSYRVSCGVPEVSISGGRKANNNCSSYLFGDTCEFSCSSPYLILEGSSTITCQKDGKWSEFAPFCHPMGCVAPNVTEFMPNSVLDCEGYRYGQKCNIICDQGYRMKGNFTYARCGENGELKIHGNSRCELIKCAEPEIPEHGSRLCDGSPIKPGTTCEFECYAGYIAHGNKIRTCDGTTETYSGTPTTCLPFSCNSFAAPKDVIINCNKSDISAYGFSQGDKCEFSCPANYQLQGSNSAKCENQNWEINIQYSPPKCKILNECLEVVCPQFIPNCGSNKYLIPKSMWSGCCFNEETDCMGFDQFLFFEVIITTNSSAPVVDFSNQFVDSIVEVLPIYKNQTFVFLYEKTLIPDNYLIQISVNPTLTINSETNETESNIEQLLENLINILEKNTTILLLDLHSNTDIISFSLSSVPTKVARLPLEKIISMDFNDFDGRSEWVRGYGRITTQIPHEKGISHFAIYFGDGNGNSTQNRIGPMVVKIDLANSFEDSSLPFYITPTKVPENAVNWLVFSSNPLSESRIGVSVPLVLLSREAVNLTEGHLTFKDQDDRYGWIDGDVKVTTPSYINSNNNITDFVVYFSDGGNTQLSKVGELIGEGIIDRSSLTTSIHLSQPVLVPNGVTGFLVFSRNVDIEGEIGIFEKLSNLSSSK
eukprot:c21868_g1_i1.p1 GENE.c21868_g1_i1~~c21868_g1_i1.p1  ORF type:complete len:1447 (-),score=545.96 c21868_g1_i1:128-4468(-)